jgi:uncharacterized protein (DUF2267 family)
MGDSGYAGLNRSIEKTNQVLKQIESAYGWPADRRPQSFAALRAVLHALRDRLTVDEAADLAAQLPLVVRGLYYEGWDPSKVPVKMRREEFLTRVQEQLPYEVEGGTELLVGRVLAALRRFVTDGEWKDVRSSLPREFAEILPA